MAIYDQFNDEIIELFNTVEDAYPYGIAKMIRDKHGLNEKEFANLRVHVHRKYKYLLADKELVHASVKLAKQKQKAQDINRIERKAFREHARLENAVAEYNKALIDELQEQSKNITTTYHPPRPARPKGIVHISDWHLNELINLPHNKFDFEIAAKRAKQLADDAISYFKWRKVNEVVLAFGGDMLNSDRRLDELLSMATNRAKATQLSIRLLRMFVEHLNRHFNITAVGVTGNESRAKQELGWSDVLATDSYDYTIYDTLKLLYEGKKGVEFTPMEANEVVFTLNKKNFLLIHGHQIGKDVQKGVQNIIGKFASKGIEIHYVLEGHIHAAHVGDYFSRNASLAGSNAYSEQGLNYVSKASQNLHIVYQYDKIDSMKVDVQDVRNVKGYPIEKQVDAYNAKSTAKLRTPKEKFSIVVI
jgi:predicted phosphodiesterase